MTHRTAPRPGRGKLPLVAIACWLSSAAIVTAQGGNIIYTLDGEADSNLFGISIDGLSDLDGDGHPDFVVGAYGHNNDTGQVKVISGNTGNVIHTFLGENSGDRFGCACAGAGDVNRDGFEDIVVGSYRNDAIAPDAGQARVYSGRDGSVLYTFFGDSAGDEFGNAVAGAGDVNRDGYDDILVAAYLDDVNGQDSGSVYVFSGRNGNQLHKFSGDSPHDWFGYSVHSAGDVNRDGRSDVIVGACYDDAAMFNAGTAYVYSGRNGALLRTLLGSAASDWFGSSVAGCGDVDNDNFPDLIVGAPGAGPANHGAATVFSGRNGSVLHHMTGQMAGDEFGVSVRDCGDVDDDGRPDAIIGAYRGSSANPLGGSTYIYSGRNGSTIATFQADSPDDRLGIAVAGIGDVNGDGRPDVAAGAVYDDNSGSNAGSVRVYSGTALPLSSDVLSISANDGGTQTLTVDAGASHAGRRYWILGSASGTSPGISIGGFTLPLRYDSYTDYTANNTNNAILSNFAGVLDGSGKATATFNLAPGSSSMIGFTLHHAFLVYQSGGSVFMTSNAVPLTIVD